MSDTRDELKTILLKYNYDDCCGILTPLGEEKIKVALDSIMVLIKEHKMSCLEVSMRAGLIRKGFLTTQEAYERTVKVWDADCSEEDDYDEAERFRQALRHAFNIDEKTGDK